MPPSCRQYNDGLKFSIELSEIVYPGPQSGPFPAIHKGSITVSMLPFEIATEGLFAGGSEMSTLMRSFDWAASPLGPPETWCPTLQMMTRMLLSNSFPILLWWGPDFIQLYNDAYIPVLGEKHPDHALGRPFRECWSEVYHVLGPLAEVPYQGGPSTWIEDIPVELNRYSYKEEAHFTISYSPVPDPSAPRGIGGVIAIVHEISQKIVSDRRILALRDLASRSAKAKTAEEACAEAATTLANYRKDVPFALLYLLDEAEGVARLAGHSGTDSCPSIHPACIGLHDHSAIWPFQECLQRDDIVVVDDVAGRFGKVPAGPWSSPPDSAAVVPIQSHMARHLSGFLVAGISSRLRFDDGYRGFFELASAQIATSIANARAYEMERRRNEALAEIDRAKTIFFSNISHELRTPLTLITGPIEEMLAASSSIRPEEREQLELAHRNSLRMLKLVNTLLDFSRIEAGRVKASLEPIDLSALTAELASVFRSTIERAGLRLVVDCPPMSRPALFDREMWEKIVFNLLSNAFKFTFEGEIKVSVHERTNAVEVVVSDTGTGIPADELPNLFKRFHRVRGARGRSYEGSGIGLALVHELVRLHGGTVQIESEIDKGSRFIVSLPLGNAPMNEPCEARPAAVKPDAFIYEMDRWLANDATCPIDLRPSAIPWKSQVPKAKQLILIADDNADMREYLSRLLDSEYKTVAVSDGAQALDAARRLHPDLVIADVMMPLVDGFGLLRAIREDPVQFCTPVILLSARAGEESRVEGMQAGADDYIVKPFPGRELLARVESHLALFKLRREAQDEIRQSEERFRALVAASTEVIYQMNPDWTELRRLAGRKFIADTESPDRTWLERYILPEDRPMVTAAIGNAVRNKCTFQLEHRVIRSDGTPGWTFSRAVPLIDANGNIKEWFGAATDITARKQAETALLLSERLSALGRMASTIAHEINNPLAALTNLIFLASQAERLPDSARYYLKEAESELQRVAHITRQALGFYRESKAPEFVRIDAVVDSALDMLNSKIRAKRVTVEKQWRTDRPVAVVVGELRQVFSNLIANSIDAIDEQGTIKIRTSLHQNPSGKPELRVTIADNGKGINSSARPHIFEPLYTTKDTIGTGLGLWVSRQIIERHHGAIQVQSRINGACTGSTFSITLPVSPGA